MRGEEFAYKEPRGDIGVGTSLAQQYGSYIAERLFVSDEAANSPSQIGGRRNGTRLNLARGGDIKHLDVNNDGVIDEKDIFIGNPDHPEIVYGFGVSAGYVLLISFSFRQGSAINFLDRCGATFFQNNNNNCWKVYDSHWAGRSSVRCICGMAD